MIKSLMTRIARRIKEWITRWRWRKRRRAPAQHIMLTPSTLKLVKDKLKWKDYNLCALAEEIFKIQSRAARRTPILKTFVEALRRDSHQIVEIGEKAVTISPNFLRANFHSVYVRRACYQLTELERAVEMVENAIKYDIHWQLRALIEMDQEKRLKEPSE